MPGEHKIQMSEDYDGKMVPNLNNPWSWVSPNWFQECFEDTQGITTGTDVGTFLWGKAVAAGEILIIKDWNFISKVATRQLSVAIIDTNANLVAVMAGTANILLATELLLVAATVYVEEVVAAAANTKNPKEYRNAPPQLICNNKLGTTTKYVIIFIPDLSSGATGNSVNTDFYSGNICGVLIP